MTRATLTATAILNIFVVSAAAQGRGGRGIPSATPEQTAAVSQMNAELAPQAERLAAAREELIAAALAQPADDAAIRTKAEAIRSLELDLARARAAAFAKLQASANKLTAQQAAALGNSGAGGRGGGGRGAYRTSMPHVTAKQATALIEMSSKLQTLVQNLNAARSRATAAAFVEP